MKRKESLLAYSSLVGAMLIFGTIGIFRRWIPLSSALLACARGLLGSAILLLVLLLKKEKTEKIERRDLILAITSGVLIGYNWVLLFEAYRHTSVATATLCYYMAPTFVILFSPFVLKEKPTLKKAVCAMCAVVGTVFVSGITGGAEKAQGAPLGIFFGLGAALLYASVILLNQFIHIKSTVKRTVIQLFSAAVCMIPYLLLTEDFTAVSLSAKDVLLVVLVGVLHTGVAYALYFGSMTRLKAQSVAVLSYLDPATALLFSFLLLHEEMTLLSFLGALLILGAALLSEIQISRPHKKKENP